MSGFLRRFLDEPTIDVIKQIEGVIIIDNAPPDPATGAGSGTVLLVGEFEDGYFATDVAIKGTAEVFGSDDFETKFGSFGYVYSNVVASNPCARRHLQEFWNGNGWLKAYKMRARRILISRVDTSVGSVSFDPLAAIGGGVGPWPVATGDTLGVTSNIGTGSSTAIAATLATVAGSGAAFGTIVSGETFGVRIDNGPQVNVQFGGADTTQAAVIARINSTLGYTAAVANGAQVDMVSLQRGTGAKVQLIQVTSGLLTKLGWVAGSVAGTGNVANLNAVTVDEIVSIVNGTSALNTNQVKAQKAADGSLRIYNNVAASVSTIRVDAAGPLAAKLGISPIDTVVSAVGHAGGVIPAGTRVRSSSTAADFVTMQTLTIPAAAAGPYSVKVRHALDDGTGLTSAAGTLTQLIDNVGWAVLTVNNASAVTAALTEVQLDAAYVAALDRTLDESGPARDANYLLIARRSDAVVRAGKANALKATACGMYARKFITGDPIGTPTSQILANVALYRDDRVFYTGKALRVRVDSIAVRGEAGGLGFTADGVISVRPDGPLTTICAMLPPEENPGQQTGLIDDFFEVDTGGEPLTIDHYTAFKAGGVEVPRADRISGMVFQSGVTSSLVSGRTTAARRKFADYVQDTLAEISAPYVKRLAKQTRRDRLRTEIETFLGGLKSDGNPEAARLVGYNVDDGVNAGNTPAITAQGIFYINTVVRSLPSMDNIVHRTNIGPNAVLVSEV